MKRLAIVAALPLAGFVASAASAQQQPAALAPAAAAAFRPSPAQAALLARAQRAGATEIVASAAPGDGMILNGKLDGRAFVLALPAGWNHEAVLFGQGYGTPGATPTVPADPIAKDPGGGTLRHVYEQGLAVGIAAFDKSGVATESGAKNALRLRDLIAKLGATHFYALGGSMGGSIVMALIELHPKAFAGAVSMCGITQGWLPLIRQLADMRGAYNVLTQGTPYALPGDKDVTHSALPTVPPAGNTTPGDTFREQQKMKVLIPVFALFQAAKTNPAGHESRIIRQVAAIGGFAPDPAALGAPLYAAALGMDDIVATMGGQPVGNVDTVYAPPEMSAVEAADFNRRMQRYTADAKAIGYARQWHESTGRFRVPLLTVHQTIDALVPYSQSEALGRMVARAGNTRNLVQYAVPPTRMPLPGGFEGYTHCGFTPAQNVAAFEAMRNWVKTGKRPAPGAVQ